MGEVRPTVHLSSDRADTTICGILEPANSVPPKSVGTDVWADDNTPVEEHHYCKICYERKDLALLADMDLE